jgi:putative transposase
VSSQAGANFLQQRARFDDFIEEFNTDGHTRRLTWPARRALQRLTTTLSRPAGARLSVPQPDLTVSTCGRICYKRKKINLSLDFACQAVDIKQVEDHILLASFMNYDPGYFDDETCRLAPLLNPFGAKVSPMS